MKDLGVIFDTELNFVQHCKEKINIAYSYLGIIKRNFIYLDEDAFVMLYKSLVRSHLEYANSVWNLMLIYINLDLNTLMLEAGAGKNGPGKNGPGKNGPGKNGPEKTVR